MFVNSVNKNKLKMKLTHLAILFILFSPLAFAHGEGHEGEESDASQFTPFYYLEENDYWGALFITLVWFVLIKGFWELTKLILGRALYKEK